MRAKHVLFAFFLLLPTTSSLFAQTLEDPSLRVDQLVSGLSSPTTMAFIADNDILVLQKDDGKVRRVIDGVLQAGHVLDVHVDNDSERGLLGIALHPQFSSNHFVYLYYTESSTGSDTSGTAPLGNRVYRYTWNGSNLVSPTLIMNLNLPATPGPNHDGGIITFGPDGKLYAVIGDLNHNGQLQNFSLGAPDNTSVIFRLNEDGSIPTDNPFFGQSGHLPKYYAYGIRNSFGLAFDPVTDKLWMTENGPNLYDEINLVEPGFNSGWERIMGPASRDTEGTSDLFVIPNSRYSDPEFSWLDTVGPTALAFNSTALGINYENDLFVGDINGGNLYRFKLNAARTGFIFNPGGGIDLDLVADNPTEVNEARIGSGFGGITDLKIGPDGLLYVVSFSGSIYVISANAPVTHTLSVTSTNPGSGVSISVTPNDNNGAGNGTTPFNRTYNNGTLVTLTAPSTAGGNTFLKWQRDGSDHSSTQNTQITMDANHTMTAVYGSAIIIDNAPAGQMGNGTSFTGKWCTAKSPSPFGANSLESCGKQTDTYRWTPTIPTTGLYDVYIWWTQHRKNSNNVPITVCRGAACTTLNFNQQQNGGQWNLHGRYSFNAGSTGGYVQVTDQNGRAIADAVRFVPAP